MSESFRHLWGRTDDATPPTPDPRERGEDEYVPPPASDEAQLIASISRPTDMVSLTRAAFDSLTDEVVALRAKVAALRAPAPSEAMAKDLATVTAVCAVGKNHPIGCLAREHGVFFCDCGFTDAVTRLNTHPAPAVLTAALTPDAERDK